MHPLLKKILNSTPAGRHVGGRGGLTTAILVGGVGGEKDRVGEKCRGG